MNQLPGVVGLVFHEYSQYFFLSLLQYEQMVNILALDLLRYQVVMIIVIEVFFLIIIIAQLYR